MDSLFEDPGYKIKKISRIIFIINCFLSFFWGFLVFILIGKLEDWEFFACICGVLAWVVTTIVGIIVAWLTALLFYAFGELVDTNQEIRDISRAEWREQQ